MLSETHTPQGDMLIRDILKHMRHDGCGGRPRRRSYSQASRRASSPPVRRIVLIGQNARTAGI
jgi:hypothetical protein